MSLRKLILTLEMIKFEHSVFALPFALTAATLAIRDGALPLAVLWSKLLWIILAMVGARSAAMTFNRLVDSEIDARNPRTKLRQLPAGTLSRGFAWSFFALSCVVLLFASAMLNSLCLRLAPVALGVVLGYSYTKRFTSMAHLVLGFALGIAPAAAWIAVRGSLDPRILWLTAAVTFWTAGFDIIYSCQDYEFDSRAGLFSIPAKLGLARALGVARLFHLIMLGCLMALWWSFAGGGAALAGIVVVAGMLLYEHSLVKPTDFSRVDAAFFTVNGYIGVLFFAAWLADWALA